MAAPRGEVRLRFGGDGIAQEHLESLLGGLSAAARVGEHLWTASDERPALDRLTLQPDGSYGAHRSFPIADLIDLPGKGEIDVEGIAWEAPYLWVVGSHSRRRDRPEDGDDATRAADRLAQVDDDCSRAVVARVPLAPGADGAPEPRSSCPDPRAPDRRLTAARLKGKGRRAGLLRLLEDDPHLWASLRWPGKDNGFDVEGLAVAEGRLFVGLRGPVLRGWAVVLELALEDGKRPERLRALRIGPEGERYRKHFLHLDGLGIRDLAADGGDLLILAGPTADVAGPASIFRWRGGARPEGPTVLARGQAERLLDLPVDPHSEHDHPEGIVLDGGGAGTLLVVYDAVGPGRREGAAVKADVFAR